MNVKLFLLLEILVNIINVTNNILYPVQSWEMLVGTSIGHKINSADIYHLIEGLVRLWGCMVLAQTALLVYAYLHAAFVWPCYLSLLVGEILITPVFFFMILSVGTWNTSTCAFLLILVVLAVARLCYLVVNRKTSRKSLTEEKED